MCKKPLLLHVPIERLRPQTPIYIQLLENVQETTPIERFWLMQMLVILGFESKRNLYFIF